MRESDLFNEKQETKRATFTCPHCRERGEYDVRWLRRTKKTAPPRGMSEQDRARFQKSRDYMVRVDDIDKHYAGVSAAGAMTLSEPADMPFGERQYTVSDPAGHHWTFTQSVTNLAPEDWGGQTIQPW